jgi:cytochrome P450
MIKTLLDPKLREERKTQRMSTEARTIFSAAAPTTSATVVNATLHLLSDPAILHRLKIELKAVIPDADSSPTLQ